MSNESNKVDQEIIDAEVVNETETEVAAEEATEVDALTQANLKIEALEQQLAETQAALAERKDVEIRAAAETANIRARAAKDVEKARAFALEKFVNELLPVLDNMERALAGVDAEDEATKAIAEGVELTMKGLMAAVEKNGVVLVNPLGEAFNPNHHQAIGMQPSAEYPKDTVMLVMQKGYILKDRVLRPAMVMVSQGGASVDTQA
ncbi:MULTISPECIES: nucleotide exchange factor GrpE [unclassified Shewanella]|uniref:nucleotide exchange factor GrpE n=1 Tax=unclassified Shewanella TaxID=196818 RepID=UPI000970B098|nr:MULTISPECIES: nucleotide exchange factor GrpE [unclassified Shewanella]MDO6618648.1 nucleotide exchange factor GrpE [Shewanella sp. 6_MG-2023]MDO6641151.1 nucleotide exchange factor GrpE [Shewanella sp. 5_MG-2023]MDO6678563.1 nucleotide exchange factor GrpE [Shewanella sp. 4_MG-2023]MDO6774695.1 nucleotide exchange factor GrpE [Shewanella sp. 3_MG-2023]PMG31989.1 nucleotide exchange factor GrpE [Shewanella sp. 10N.286.52.C2]